MINPHDLTATELFVWGVALHAVADFPLQNDWMANRKPYLTRSLAGYIHAGIHGLLLSIVFGWYAVPLAIVHLLIDTRKPIIWWSKFVGQTQPMGKSYYQRWDATKPVEEIPVYDMGTEVRIWTDQVFHVICIAIAALLIG
jgi:Protein of unknown function (DUF3307)